MMLDAKELQKIRGVGEVLSRRFLEAGYDSFAKIAAAGEDTLRKIPGVNPKTLGSIIAQAGELAGEKTEKSPVGRDSVLKQQAAALRERIQGLALEIRDRFREQAAGKMGKKAAKEIMNVICYLERVETTLPPKVKKAGKTLIRAEKRLEGLAEAGLGKIRRRLKKARKALAKVAR